MEPTEDQYQPQQHPPPPHPRHAPPPFASEFADHHPSRGPGGFEQDRDRDRDRDRDDRPVQRDRDRGGRKEFGARRDPRGEGGDRDRGPMPPAGDLQFRFLVRSSEFGLVVGPKGSNINRVRSGTGFTSRCEIHDVTPNMLRSVGLAEGDVKFRCVTIQSDVDETAVANAAKGAVVLFDTLTKSSQEPEAGTVMRLLVSHEQASVLIGKRGHTIQGLRSKTGAIIGCFKAHEKETRGVPMSGDEELIMIEGPPETIRKALPDVMEAIRLPTGGPPRICPEGLSMRGLEDLARKIKAGGPNAGVPHTSTRMADRERTRDREPERDRDHDRDRDRTLQGQPMVNPPQQTYAAAPQQQAYAAAMAPAPIAMPAPLPMVGAAPPVVLQEPVSILFRMLVPVERLGWINNGATIAQIIASTGANVQANAPTDPAAFDRIVTIWASEDPSLAHRGASKTVEGVLRIGAILNVDAVACTRLLFHESDARALFGAVRSPAPALEAIAVKYGIRIELNLERSPAQDATEVMLAFKGGPREVEVSVRDVGYLFRDSAVKTALSKRQAEQPAPIPGPPYAPVPGPPYAPVYAPPYGDTAPPYGPGALPYGTAPPPPAAVPGPYMPQMMQAQGPAQAAYGQDARPQPYQPRDFREDRRGGGRERSRSRSPRRGGREDYRDNQGKGRGRGRGGDRRYPDRR